MEKDNKMYEKAVKLLLKDKDNLKKQIDITNEWARLEDKAKDPKERQRINEKYSKLFDKSNKKIDKAFKESNNFMSKTFLKRLFKGASKK